MLSAGSCGAGAGSWGEEGTLLPPPVASTSLLLGLCLSPAPSGSSCGLQKSTEAPESQLETARTNSGARLVPAQY